MGQAPSRDQKKPVISARAIVLGAILTPLNAFWIVRLERVMFGPYPSTVALFANVVFLLFVGVFLNALLRRYFPRAAFSQGELLTIYTMLAISTGLAGLDGVGNLDQMIPEGSWFGKSNHWESFLGAFPKWMVVTDPEVVRGHFLGNTTFYQANVLRAWAVPIFAWTLFITLILFVANCLNVLVRRQWADRERLTFPIIWLPVEMTDTSAAEPFFRNRLMWAGFAIAGLLSLWNGIAFLYPSLPSLPIGIVDLKPLFSAKPWSAMDWFPITLYPLAIGLSFLLPLDLLFSCWFFFLFWKGQTVVSSGMGWDTTPDFPFIREQGFGSVAGLFIFYLWSGRRAYAEIWRSAIRRGRQPVDPGAPIEALSDRAALFGAIAGLLALVIFAMVAGVALWVALVFFSVYVATLMVVSRIRAELGSPVHDFHFMGPDSMLPRIASTVHLQPADLAFFTFGYGLARAHRSDTAPVGLEGLQMARIRHMEPRRMFGAIMLAVVLGTLGTFWAIEHQAYALGAAAKFNQGSGFANEAFRRMASWSGGTLDKRPNGMATMAMGVGLLTTFGLLILRMRFFGFPFHPLGYAISSSWAINLVWLPMLIAWALKGITMRYGGLRAYRKFLPFFLGLILGDCVMGSAWALLSLVLHMRTYNFFGG